MGKYDAIQQLEWAVAVLCNDALPFDREHDLPVAAAWELETEPGFGI